jgi:DNA-binding NarL/FixJ family response regulator
LKDECHVVGELSSGHLVIESAARLEPDVVVLDLNLPDASGLDFVPGAGPERRRRPPRNPDGPH